MDVLNPSPVLCLPQAMWLVYRVVMAKPDLDRDEILDLVTPAAMRAGSPMQGAHAPRALAALREFGLVREDAEGLLQADAVTDPHEFLRLLRRRLVLPPAEVSSDFQGAPDLRAALVWLMRQSPLVPLHYAVNVQTNMPAGLFTNDTRWNGFRWWSRALGFGQEALKALAVDADSKAKIIPDPTVAVIDVIRHPFGDALPRGQHIPIDILQALRRLVSATLLLVDQLRDFPLGTHDDGPDALEMALHLAEDDYRRGRADDGLGSRLIS